jgi:hypothetical protein
MAYFIMEVFGLYLTNIYLLAVLMWRAKVMKYYKLMMDYNGTKEEDMVCYVEEGFSQKYGIDEYAMYDCKTIENWNNNLTFYYNPLEGSVPNDYLATNLRWLIVSERCRKILDDVGVNNVEYLPIKIKSQHDGSEINGFSLVNVLGETDALNISFSDYSYLELDDEKILNVRKYAVNKNDVSNLHIFRLKDDTIPVFVSETVKKAFIKNKINGFDYLEIKVV